MLKRFRPLKQCSEAAAPSFVPVAIKGAVSDSPTAAPSRPIRAVTGMVEVILRNGWVLEGQPRGTCAVGGVRGGTLGVIALSSGARLWLAAGVTDMRKRFDRLAGLVQQRLGQACFQDSCSCSALGAAT